MFGEVNVRFSSVRRVYTILGRSLRGFRSVADPCSSTRLQIAFTEQTFHPFSENFATVVRYPNQVSTMS